MWRRTSRDRLVILGLILATVAVLTLDFRTGLIDGLASATSQVVGVFQAGVRTLISPVEGAVEGIGDFGNLRDENATLEQENEVLRRQAETFRDLARENARLRQLLQLEGSFDLDTVSGRVIGASLSGLERSALVDKGRADGVTENGAVIGPEGLVGRVSWAGGRSAKVLLITDSRSGVGVRVGESGETGIVQGTGGRMLRLELVDRAALDQGGIKRGDEVLTSGHQGGIFPPGIPVGRVEEVSQADRGNAYTILVRPFARLSRLDVLSIVVEQGEVIEAPPTPTPGLDRTTPSPSGGLDGSEDIEGAGDGA